MNLTRKIIESVRQSTDENEVAVNNIGDSGPDTTNVFGPVATFPSLLLRKMLRRWKKAVDNK